LVGSSRRFAGDYGRKAGALNVLLHGWRFTRGAVRLLRAKAVSVPEALAQLKEEITRREERFLHVLDELVWPNPRSPYRGLLKHAGIGPEDVRHLVRTSGVEGALEVFRDEGVYISYEEWQGLEPARRGSEMFSFKPLDFFNPRLKPEFSTGTGGTRSGGIALASSFESRRIGRGSRLVTLHLWGAVDAPVAMWRPALPGGGVSSILYITSTLGHPPERWFSQIPSVMPGVAFRKKVANVLLPVVGRLAGVKLPGPEYVPTSDPSPILKWIRVTLRSNGTAYLHTYASSAARLAASALDQGVSLEGLVISMGGEPVTVGKLKVVRESGARAINRYACVQAGGIGTSCPFCEDEELHAMENAVALIQRIRARPDGEEVGAFLCTTLQARSSNVLINVEIDDYGEIRRNAPPCACGLGRLGFRTRLFGVRGISKVVSGGVTIRGEVLEYMADVLLPERFAGASGDFQFVEEEERGRTLLTVRVDPRLKEVDDGEVLGAVRQTLRGHELGLLADEVLAPSGSLRVVRKAPVPAPSGKILPFERLRPPQNSEKPPVAVASEEAELP
jgi:hypothetical protein